MVIEVNYQTKTDAVDPNPEVERREFFECSAMPDKTTIAHEMIQMGRDFAENTITVSEYKIKSAEELRASGMKVRKLN